MNKNHSLYSEFAKYVSFNAFSMLGFSCYILADTLFVANALGSGGLTALNLVLPLYSVISAVGLMIGMGGATRYAILMGEDKKEEASLTFTHALAVGLLIGVVLTLIGLFFAGNLAEMLGADAEILPMAESYLRTLTTFACAFISNNILVCFVRNDQNPRLAMIAMLSGSLSNVVLDYVFMFPLEMGMFGAALATCMAPLISLVILSLHKIRKQNQFHLKWGKLKGRIVSDLCKLGAASFVNELSSGVVMLLFNFMILRIAGNLGVAAYGIIANLALILVALFTGVAQGIQPLLSNYCGKGDSASIRVVFRLAIGLSLILGVCFYLTALLFPDTIIALFNRDQDMVLAQMTQDGIGIYFSAFLLMGTNIVSSAYFSAIGRAIPSFAISLTRGFLAIVLLLFPLSALLGLTGIWLVVPLAEFTTLIVTGICLSKNRICS